MTPEQFVYWLQGFVEMHPTENIPTPQQWLMIKDHLQTVFTKVTPERNGNAPNLAELIKEAQKQRPDLFRPLDTAIC